MPLRWKLVATYAIVVAIVVAGFSVAMVTALRSSLERGVASELVTRARAIGAAVEFEGGAWVLERGAAFDDEAAGERRRYYRVVGEDRRVLLASPLALALSARTVLPLAEAPGQRIWSDGGRRFLEVSMSVAKPGDDDETAPPATLQVTCGMDLHDVDLAVGSLTRSLLWLGPLVLLLSLAGGVVLAGRALRPIDQIARTAAAIGSSDLGQRIPVRGRDELATLAAVLNGTFERLQQAFARQDRFTADAAHELRTPLAVVAGNIELALGRARSPDELRELLREASAAVLQMQALIEGLLTLARAGDSSVTGAFGTSAVDVAQLCREVVHAEAGSAKANGVDVSCNDVADLSVRGDAACLQQLLRNLVRNGVRYNRSGGHVVVHARRADGQAVIEVEDDGIGIPADALPRLGERFFRVDSSRTRATGGCGLGLSIAMAIAEAHGGAVQVRSVEHRGTRVSVELPLARVG